MSKDFKGYFLSLRSFKEAWEPCLPKNSENAFVNKSHLGNFILVDTQVVCLVFNDKTVGTPDLEAVSTTSVEDSFNNIYLQ